MVRREALPTTLWASEWGRTSFDIHGIGSKYLLLAPSDLLTTTAQENFVVWTSTFNGPIRSLAISSASRCVAIAFGSEIVLAQVLFDPHRLKYERRHLPKLPSASQLPKKLPEPIATSLCFLGSKNQLLVTYATHGIVYVVALLPCANLTRA